MPEYLPVAKAGVLSVGSLKQVFVGDQELLLMNVAGKICATQGYCGHMHLHLGKLTSDVLQCPFHSAKFGVETGVVFESHEPQIDKQLKKRGRTPYGR